MPAEERALTSGALFEDGEVAVIGESLQTPLSDGRHRRMLCREAKERTVPSKRRA